MRQAVIGGLVLVLAAAGPAAADEVGKTPAQEDSPTAMSAPMDRLAWMVGTWQGAGWMQMGTERHETDVTETIISKLDGRVLILEGVGTSNGEVKHHAVAMLTYDPGDNVYRMRSVLHDGRTVDAIGTWNDDAFSWGFDPPQGGSVRYTLHHDAAGRWVEKGEFSRDGKTWMPFFSMTLERVDEE